MPFLGSQTDFVSPSVSSAGSSATSSLTKIGGAGSLKIVGLGFQAIGEFQKIQTIRETSKLNAEIAKNNAELFKQNAALADKRLDIVKKENQIEEARFRKSAKAFKSRQRAVIGRTGITSESFEDVVTETAIDLELDALAIRYSGRIKEGAVTAEQTALLTRGLSEERRAARFTSQARQAGSDALLSGLKSGVDILQELDRQGVFTRSN